MSEVGGMGSVSEVGRGMIVMIVGGEGFVSEVGRDRGRGGIVGGGIVGGDPDPFGRLLLNKCVWK